MMQLGSVIVSGQEAKARLARAGATFVSTIEGASFYSHSQGKRFVEVRHAPGGKFELIEHDEKCDCNKKGG